MRHRKRGFLTLIAMLLACVAVLGGTRASANVPGGIISSATTAVTITNGSNGPTISNGIVQIVCSTNGASLSQINYTYNNGGGTVTKQMLLNGKDGGEFYWEYGGYGGSTWTYNVVVDPSTNGGSYAEVAFTSLASGTAAAGDLQVNFSMLRGSPGFYTTLTMKHHAGDVATGLGEMRTNIYIAPDFNWMSVSPTVQRELGINATFVPAYDSTQEDSLCVSGVNAGTYDDKYKFSQLWGTQRVWGWGSVNDPAHGVTSGQNVGIWYCLASTEYYNGGPLKPELMDAPMVNMLNGGHYYMGSDSSWSANENWTRVQGPFFVYCNNVSKTLTDPIATSQALYADAVAQGAAEATAWPYSWFNNATYDSNYAQAAQRGTVTGKMVINDVDNPNASAANLWVGVIQQPATTDNVYDFQEWYKPYQFWTRTDSGGNFTIPAVISGTNYTLWAFGPGAAGTFMSQSQAGGNPPYHVDLPAVPFSVSVTGSATTSLGAITWTPARVGPTVFEIGYPDRTGHKFRHGDDWWVGGIGPSPTQPSPIWTQFLDYPFDFPNGMTYTVGVSKWPTDWDFIQPIMVTSNEGNASTSSTIVFNLPSGVPKSAVTSLYLGLASDYYGAVEVSVNGTNLGNVSGVTATPNSLPASGFIPSYTLSDSSIREGCNGAFSDERITFPSSLLVTGSNNIGLSLRQVGGSYFADHFMYDYIRLEMTGYIPPAPANVSAYAGNNAVLLSWPTTPGANSYNVLRTTTSGSNYTAIASGNGGATGPVCGSGPANATYLDTTASNGTTYYYAVQSVNTTGSSANSPQSAAVTPASALATAPPAAPTGITVTGSNGNVALSWTASPGANYYTVLRSTIVDKIPTWTATPAITSTSTVLSTITLSNTQTATTYVDNAVTLGSKYAYTAEATNAAGTSSTSNAMIAKPVPASAPATPMVTAMPGIGKITLNWAAVPSAVGYILQSAASASGPYTFVSSISGLTYGFTGLANNTTYYYTVTAMNADAVSTSATISATTALGPPSGLVAFAGNTQVTLTWSGEAGATSYVVERSTVTGGPYTTIGTSAGPSYTDNGLTNGTTYYYVIAGNNASGTGVTSAQASATPASDVPVAPLGLTATGGHASIALSWTASAGASSYTVYRSSTTGGPYSVLASGVTATTYNNTGLPASTAYFYVVSGSNSTGMGAYSAEATAATLPNSVSTYTWDAGGASPAKPVDGAGTWNTTSALWSNGGSDVAWPNDGSGFASIGDNNGAAGTITVGNITAAGLLFSPAGSGGYTLSSGTLSLIGSGQVITANTNVTIGATLIASGTLTMNGNSTVTFTNPASVSGTIAMDAMTVNLDGPTYSAPMLGTATLDFYGGILMNTSANTNIASEFSNPINVNGGETGSVIFSSRNGWGGSTFNPAVTGGGTLNFYIGSNLAGSRDALYPNFSAFTGQVNLIGSVPNAGIQYYFSNGAQGSASATWNFGSGGTTVILYPQTNSAGNSMSLGVLTGGAGGELAGGSAGMITYDIGGAGADSTFPGSIVGNTGSTPGNAAITKVGGGTQILSGNCAYTGPTNVLDGVLEITGTLAGTSSLTVANGAVFYLAGGSASISGDIMNNGIFKISGTPAFSLSGTFTNNGVVDLINGNASLPANFINDGTVLTAANVQVQQLALSGSSFSVSIQSYPEHQYQLQEAATLTNPAWTNVGASQSGDGTVLTFTDPAAGGAQRFYQILVSP
jgi:autotransporter-associated beta strand protein